MVCLARWSLLISVAILMRCASPPDSVVADWPSVKYPRPRSFSTAIFLPTAGSRSNRRMVTPDRPRRSYYGADIPMAVIRRYARRVGTRFRPDKVILFGSRAYGTPHADSDVDLLVIMPARNQIDQAIRIRRECPAPFPMDLIVRTPHNIGWRLEEGESFHTEIVTKGKVLYEKKHAGMGAKGRGRLPARPTTRPRKGTLL